MSRRSTTGVAVASLVVCTLLACRSGDEHDDNNFRADVIECEDALAHLEECCPGFDATPVLCNFYYDKTSGCGSTETSSEEPALTQAESSCIRDRSCEALVENKVCERAQAARSYKKQTSTSITSSSSSSSGAYTSYGASPSGQAVSHTTVCP